MENQQRIANQPGSISHKGAFVLLVATYLAFSLPALSQTTPPAPTTGAGMASPPSSKGMSKPMTGEMGQAMTRGMKEMESMPMSGDTDHDFAMMMRTHHQSAVDMAEIELRTGKDPTLRSMAKNIISSQKKEIKEFDDWMKKHPGNASTEMHK
jgi:uncharacterized protein (DUF305 family)